MAVAVALGPWPGPLALGPCLREWPLSLAVGLGTWPQALPQACLVSLSLSLSLLLHLSLFVFVAVYVYVYCSGKNNYLNIFLETFSKQILRVAPRGRARPDLANVWHISIPIHPPNG